MGRSGGPKTTQGKALVALNAVSHGIYAQAPVVPGLERAEDWDAHRAGVCTSLSPLGHVEETLAERIAVLLWRLRRVVRFETESIALGQELVEEDLDRDYRLRAVFSGGGVPPEEARRRLATKRADLRLLKQFDALPAEQRLSGSEAASIIWSVADAAGLGEYGLELPGIPEDADLEDIRNWTAGRLRECINALAEQADVEPTELMTSAIQAAHDKLTNAKRDVEQADEALRRMRRERIIPADVPLNKVLRYEAHLSRQLYAALHELEAMQARRAGEAAPLARLEVSGLGE
jgi:hypothetical protein